MSYEDLNHWVVMGGINFSDMKYVITPTLKVADNEKTRTHVWELAAQRISQYVEPSYIGDDMLRGWEDEVRARDAYQEKTALAVEEIGFITNDKWGFIKYTYGSNQQEYFHQYLQCAATLKAIVLELYCLAKQSNQVPFPNEIHISTLAR